MTDAAPLTNIDLAGVWTLATRALDKANDVAVKQAVIDAKLDQHLAWCVKAREDDRRDAQEWREGLGKRLDSFGRYGVSGMIGIIGLLVTIVGYLLTHGGVKFGG